MPCLLNLINNSGVPLSGLMILIPINDHWLQLKAITIKDAVFIIHAWCKISNLYVKVYCCNE